MYFRVLSKEEILKMVNRGRSHTPYKWDELPLKYGFPASQLRLAGRLLEVKYGEFEQHVKGYPSYNLPGSFRVTLISEEQAVKLIHIMFPIFQIEKCKEFPDYFEYGGWGGAHELIYRYIGVKDYP